MDNNHCFQRKNCTLNTHSKYVIYKSIYGIITVLLILLINTHLAYAQEYEVIIPKIKGIQVIPGESE